MKKNLIKLISLATLITATINLASPFNLTSAQILEKKIEEQNSIPQTSQTESYIREYAKQISLNRPETAKIELMTSNYTGVYQIISTTGTMGEAGYCKVETTPYTWLTEKPKQPLGALLSYRLSQDETLLFSISKFNSETLGQIIGIVLSKTGKEKIEKIIYSAKEDNVTKTTIIINEKTTRAEEIVTKKEIEPYLEILDNILLNYGMEKN